MTIVHNPCPPGLEPQAVRSLQGLDRALRTARLTRALNVLYWTAILAVLAIAAALVFDRDDPVRDRRYEVANPGRQVRQGEQLLVRATRTRVRQCEVTRRWSVIDGSGRRANYEPEPFDAYGPLWRDVSTEGPVIPLDATPGRGRFVSVLAFDCNPLQRATGWSITLISPIVEFEIVPR